MLKCRNYLLGFATAAAVAVGLGPMAAAGSFQFDPAATNGGLLALDPSQGAFSVTGGTGALYDNFALNSSDNGYTWEPR